MSTTAPGALTHTLEEKLQAIPESARTTKVGGQFWIWAGANIAPINWVLGALGIHLGLGLWDTVWVIAVGNLIGMSMFGFFVLLGQRTGLTGMVLSRAPFGRRGAYLPATIQAVLSIGWSAVNTWIVLDLVMALFGELGFVDPSLRNTAVRIAVAAAIMTIQVTISWLGYRAISAFEVWTVPPTLLVLVCMSAVAWFGIDLDWSYAGPPGAVLEGGARLAAVTSVMTAIGIGWGITWFTYAADYSRFVSRSVAPRKLYLASAAGQFIPVVWLALLGASLATTNGSVDPGQLVVENYGSLAIPVLLLVVHGPIATNILNIYTFSVATQALDVSLSRRTLSTVVGVFSMLVVVFLILQTDFATVLDTWLVTLVAWVATWGGVMLVHYYRIERHRSDFTVLLDPPTTTRLPGINPAGYVAFFVGMAMTWLFMYGAVPAAHGPIATALGGIDLSWLVGLLTSAGIYWVLGPRVCRRYSGYVDDAAEAGPVTASRGPGREPDFLERHGGP
jgi:toxin CptA